MSCGHVQAVVEWFGYTRPDTVPPWQLEVLARGDEEGRRRFVSANRP